jgi:hypothetical protein
LGTEHHAIAKNKNLFEGYKVDMQHELRTIQEDFSERLGTLDNYYSDNFEQFETTIEAMKKLAK